MELKINRYEDLVEKAKELYIIARLNLMINPNSNFLYKTFEVTSDDFLEFFNKKDAKLFTILVATDFLNDPDLFFEIINGVRSVKTDITLIEVESLKTRTTKIKNVYLTYDGESKKPFLAIDFIIKKK